MTNLAICQMCQTNPAVYGDGLTWSRCSACELKHNKEHPQEYKAPEEQGMDHVIVEGLTSIVLPVYMNNYTLFHYTGNCIGSVREHTDREKTPYELVVIDNGSPVKPPSLNSYYANKVIQNEKNFGVTKAWNQGIRASQGEFIVLLNNDVQVFEHWLEDMRDAIQTENYDLVMAHPMYSLTEPFARATEAKIRRKLALDKGQDARRKDFKDFSCVMMRRSLLDEHGLFDERFFNYASDSDFFKRMKAAGKKWACLEYVPTSHISDATGYSIPETPEIMNKDKQVYADKYATV